MADWTVLGVAALGTVGTIGAGVIGFAGPSWNERRIQAGRDKKELRQAIRLIKVELTDVLSSLETQTVDAEDPLRDLQAVFALVPERTEWAAHRGSLALLMDDYMAWDSTARFHNLIDNIAGFLQNPDVSTPTSTAERLAKQLPRVIRIGRRAESRLDAILRGTHTAHREPGTGSQSDS